jgi:hypothetical protein
MIIIRTHATKPSRKYQNASEEALRSTPLSSVRTIIYYYSDGDGSFGYDKSSG